MFVEYLSAQSQSQGQALWCRLDWKLEAHRAAERVGHSHSKAITLQSIATKGGAASTVDVVHQTAEAMHLEETETSQLLGINHSSKHSSSSHPGQ